MNKCKGQSPWWERADLVGAEIDVTKLLQTASNMYDTLILLTSNPYVHLEDLVYLIREHGLQGWGVRQFQMGLLLINAVNSVLKEAQE